MRQICDQVGAACRALEVTVAGGHTEVTAAVNQPVVAGTLLGEVARRKVVRTGGCRPGDQILLVGSAAVEGTSIIAREKREALLAQGWPTAQVDEAANYLYEPGISVLAQALAAAETELVTAMHDPTEGGVATGLWEMADASGCGLEVELADVQVTPLTAARVRGVQARSAGHDRIRWIAGGRRAGECGDVARFVAAYRQDGAAHRAHAAGGGGRLRPARRQAGWCFHALMPMRL